MDFKLERDENGGVRRGDPAPARARSGAPRHRERQAAEGLARIRPKRSSSIARAAARSIAATSSALPRTQPAPRG
jgi:hypothetical protein